MTRLEEIRATSRWRDILEGQPQHLLMLTLMLCGAAWLLEGSADRGRFLGLGSLGWAWISIWLAVLHQLVVAAGFRLQLHRGLLSRAFGDRDLAAWMRLFLPLLAARPVTVGIVAVLDRGSLGFWRPGEVTLATVFLAIAAYLGYSVARYFGVPRASGGDHFRADFLSMPMVRQGIFRWSPNAMYSFGFLGLWGIALLCGSWQALVVALFQHGYIWVHYYTVEAPDMNWLYGRRLEETRRPD